MPPCAAIECARRGESWKQNAFTLYPSSPNDAAAEAPANPVPTTITSILRLLAGFTNLTVPLYFVHFCSNGPAGIFASSIKFTSLRVHKLEWLTIVYVLLVMVFM